MQREIVDRETFLYRHFDHEGRLLYLGVTYDLEQRWHGHSRSPWRSEVDRSRTLVELFRTREEAEIAEELAIALEKPLHNRAARTRRPSYKPTARRAIVSINLGELLDSGEVAELLGVKQSSVSHYTRHGVGFPQPALTKGRSPLWERKQVEAWRASHPARHVQRG